MQEITVLLLHKNSIFFDKEELLFQIQSHPSYPSLHSITDVLNHFNIENIAAEVPVNNKTLEQLPDCFITQIKKNNSLELVLAEKKKEEYILYNFKKKKEKVSKKTFLDIFTGIILVVEKNESINTKLQGNLFNYVFLTLLISGLFFLFSYYTISKVTYLALTLAIIGVLISVSIVKQGFGIKNTISDAFCSSIDEKKDCNAVLTSKGATIFKTHKLSDFSLIYFVGLTISIFFLSIQNLSINAIFFVGLISFPFTIYSIYYQAMVVKKWCLLCLSIVGVLLVFMTLPLMFTNFNTSLRFIELITIVVSFLLVFNIWNYIKPSLESSQKNKKTKIDYYKFKRNFSIFFNLLNTSAKINTRLKELPEIVFGNKKSPLEIVVVTNPFCSHCKPVHKMAEYILQKYKKEIKVIIRFNIDTANKENDVVKITSRLLEIYQTEKIDICLTAMGQIYEGKSVANWLKEWGECSKKEKYIHYLEEENIWCKENAINFTPEILINGQLYPKEYDRADLVYFIEDLYESCYFTSTENINNEFELTA